MIASAIAMLVVAASAYAAFTNTYGARVSVSGKAGTKSKPVPIGETLNLTAANALGGVTRAAPLIDIDTKIYGLVSNGGKFPVCGSATIEKAPKFNGNCPKGSQIANGRVHSLLGGPDLTVAGAPCNPYLAVYNGGKGKQWYFFYTKSASDCAGLTTGSTAPYPGTVKQSGKYLDTNVPLPPDVSTAVANHQHFYGSLIQEQLLFSKLTKTVAGKKIGLTSSVGCLHGKRPFSVKFTATDGAGLTHSGTVAGNAGGC
jgi:hypothetical protein